MSVIFLVLGMEGNLIVIFMSKMSIHYNKEDPCNLKAIFTGTNSPVTH